MTQPRDEVRNIRMDDYREYLPCWRENGISIRYAKSSIIEMFDLELTSAGESLLDGKKQNSWEA